MLSIGSIDRSVGGHVGAVKGRLYREVEIWIICGVLSFEARICF